MSENKLKEIKALLECPICLESINAVPVYQCKEGHLICKECNSNLREILIECPICRKRLNQNRSNVVEKIVQTLSPVTMVHCPVLDCQKLVDSSELNNHINKFNHEILERDKPFWR